MSMRDRLKAQKKMAASSNAAARMLANDRVLRFASGILDVRTRMRSAASLVNEALSVVVHGHALPSMNPADRDDSMIRSLSLDVSHAVLQSSVPNGGSANGSRTRGVATSVGAIATIAPDRLPTRPRAAAEEQLAQQMAARTSLARIGGRDVFEKCFKFMTADNARKMGLYPFFRPLDFNNGPEAQLEGRTVTMLGSNNYLGLTTHPRVREAAKRAIEKYGTSMTGSRLINGSMRLHHELEEKLAAYHGKEAGLVFTTGYQVNLATISALLSNRKSVAVIDKDVHASIYDGVRLAQASSARMVRYRHNDPEALDEALRQLEPGEGALIITDGVFSAQGEIANLPGVLDVAKRHKARLFIDDAHGLGVIGPGGRGTAAHFGIADEVDLIGGTFSKSLASIGGWLVGDRKVLDYIQHFASSFLFAASAAPPCVAAAMEALDVMQEEPWRQERLRENFTYMRNELRRSGFELGNTDTAVIPIYIRDDLKTVMMWKALLDDHAIYVNPFITPGVQPRQQVLRTSYMATHERKHLDRALEAFEKVGKKFGVI
jgi:8-amino-7-oxononanoate synthase